MNTNIEKVVAELKDILVKEGWNKETRRMLEEYVYPNLSNWLRTSLSTLLREEEERIVGELEKGKEGLDVNNWSKDEIASRTCNPRCHDSGKEEAFNQAIEVIRRKEN